MSERLQTAEQKSNPRRIRSLGNVVINLGFATTDELFVIRERLAIAQGNLDNDRAILDAAIDTRFNTPTEELELPKAGDVQFVDRWTDEEWNDFNDLAA